MMTELVAEFGKLEPTQAIAAALALVGFAFAIAWLIRGIF